MSTRLDPENAVLRKGALFIVCVHNVLHITSSMPTKTTMTMTTTTNIMTSRSSGCLHNGVYYPVGSHQVGDDRASNWCYGIVCEANGQTYQWDNFNCHPTTTPPTTIPPSPGPDQPKGCVYQGRFYIDNTVIQEALDKNGNPCQLVFCNSKGVLVQKHLACALVG